MIALEPCETPSLLKLVYRQKYFAGRPSCTPALEETIGDALRGRSAGLELFYLWGVHTKGVLDRYDHTALSFLVQFVSHLSNHFRCSVTFQLVIADTHAMLNRVPVELTATYVAFLEERARELGWGVSMMSDVWDKHGITPTVLEGSARQIPDEQVRGLVFSCAEKYYLRPDKLFGAKLYLAARCLEKVILPVEFRGFIHVSSAGSRLADLQPQMPTFHVWTMHRGRLVKPWLMRES